MAEDDNVHEHREQDNEDVYNADQLDKLLEQQRTEPKDQLIFNLKNLEKDPLQITPKPQPACVSSSALQQALDLLPSKNKEFKLPGRARLGITIQESNPNEIEPDFLVFLDQPIGNPYFYYQINH